MFEVVGVAVGSTLTFTVAAICIYSVIARIASGSWPQIELGNIGAA